jgi:hypothetical protein
MIFATRQSTKAENLLMNFENLKTLPSIHPLLIETLQLAVENLQPQPETSVVFTDDRAQIEWLTNGLVLKFLFSGDTQALQ